MARIIISLLAGVAGIGMLLAGLGIDAWLHAQDETLAAREGVFTLSNPGHLLLGTGIGLTCGGVLAALYLTWGATKAQGILGRQWVRVITMQASGAAAAGAVLFALAVSASGHDHGHAETASAAAAESHAHGDAAGTTPHAHDNFATSNGEQPSPAVESSVNRRTTMPQPSEGVEEPSPAVARDELAHPHAPADMPATGIVATTDDGPSDDMHLHPDGIQQAGVAATHGHPDPTPDERACFAELTAETKTVTARFADVNVAIAEGYVISDDVTKTHMPNRTYMRDGRSLDLAYPESLIYVTDASGSRRFVGALYKALKGQGPTPCGNATYWHTHGRCISPAGETIPENKDKTCPAAYEWRDGAIEMMHIWFVPRRPR
jgi:hypothetical protein